MNKPAFLFVSLILIIGCSEKSTEYFDANYEAVFKIAAKKEKFVFIDFYTPWCGPCKVFDNTMVSDSIFKDYITSNFYSTKINAEIQENKKITEKYGITAYPTFIIAKSSGGEIGRINGLNAKNPEEFVALLQGILSGNDQFSLLKEKYFENPDSIELFRKIIQEKLISNNQYSSTIELSEFAIQHSYNDELKKEAELYHAYSMINKTLDPSPFEMINYVKNENINPEFIEWGYYELYRYYNDINNTDSINHYLNILVNIDSQEHLGYLRDYAEFLYKQNINIGLADSLTKEYTEYGTNYADHWTPYLKAHSLARHGEKEKGREIFDTWMKAYSKPENFSEDRWHYYYYLEFLIFYELDSDNAVKYAEMVEKYNANEENKIRLAKIYLLNGMKDKAIQKLKEVKGLYEDPKQKENIEELIKDYKNE